MPIPAIQVPTPVRPRQLSINNAPGFRGPSAPGFGVAVGIPSPIGPGRTGYNLTGGGASFPAPAPVVPAQQQTVGTGVSPLPSGQPRPVLDRVGEMWGTAQRWAGSERGGSTLYGIAAGLQGIENPATSALGSFARGFSQALVGSYGLRSSREAAAAEAARQERAEGREDARLALDTRAQDRLDAQALGTLADQRLDNDRLERDLDAQTRGRVYTALDQYRSDLIAQFTGVPAGTFALGGEPALTPDQRREIDRLVEAERTRLLQEFGLEAGTTPAAAAPPAGPAMNTRDQPYGPYNTAPTREMQGQPLRGSGSEIDPYYGWITPEIYAGWPVGTVFYNPADGRLLRKPAAGAAPVAVTP